MKEIIAKGQVNYEFLKRMTLWHINYYFFKKSNPIMAGVLITNACNSRCIMCDFWKEQDIFVYPKDQQKRDIDSLAKNGCFYYTVSGGEPTLVSDLSERLTYAAKKIPYVRMVTNGFSISKEKIKELALSGVKEVSISIDGDEEFHCFMRGREDAFEKSINTLRMFENYAPNIRLVVNSILSPYNLESLRNLGDYLQNNHPKVYQKLVPLTAEGIFKIKSDKPLFNKKIRASYEEIDQFIDHCIKNKKIINSKIFLQKTKSYLKGNKDLLSHQKKCSFPSLALILIRREMPTPVLLVWKKKMG